MIPEKVYNKNELEQLSAKLIADISNRNPHIETLELASLLLYGASYILYVSLQKDTPMISALPKAGAFAHSYLTSPIPNRYATVPQPEESSEVQGSNREVSENPFKQ